MQLNVQTVSQTVQKPELWLKLLSAVLLVISLFLLAKLVWLWVDAFTADYRIPAPANKPRATQQQTAARVSVDAIVSKHLFGDAAAQPEEVVEQVVEATETRLPLKLRGIYASDDDKRASAIIEAGGGQQDVYFIGDKINGGSGASLHQVMATKVILNRSGQLESLTLEQQESAFTVQNDEPKDLRRAPAQAPQASSNVIDNPRVKQELGDIRNKLQTDPASLQDMLRWEPVMENGMLQGVKIAPGKARRLFYELKLRRNDIVTSINGVSLSDPSQLLMLQQNLADSSELSLSIMRNGQPQELTIKLNDSR